MQRAHYETRGYSDILNILDPASLEPLQREIYQATLPYLQPHDGSFSLLEKLRVPLLEETPYRAWADLMNGINRSGAFDSLVRSDAVTQAFERLLEQKMTYYPITRFRALFWSVGKSVYQWHQDEGVQYAMEVKDLAFWNPTTLWVSLNGADEGNSIELIPGSHRGKLRSHRFVEGQGFFLADPGPKSLREPKVRVVARSGEGIFFHSLLFHRTIPTQSRVPRYSLDIRYCPEGGRGKKYSVSFCFALRRFFSKTET